MLPQSHVTGKGVYEKYKRKSHNNGNNEEKRTKKKWLKRREEEEMQCSTFESNELLLDYISP